MFRRSWLFTLFCCLTIFLMAHSRGSQAQANTQYDVQPGDTLWAIAQRHHVTVDDLKLTNHIHSDLIQIHQTIEIPTESRRVVPVRSTHAQAATLGPVLGRSSVRRVVTGSAMIHAHLARLPHVAVHRSFSAFHAVADGDTLWRIAQDNHTTVNRLMVMNDLHSALILPGEKLRVYEGSRAVWQRMQDVHYKEQGIPMNLISVYKGAGQKYGIPWTVLAAIHHQETHFSTSGDEVSPSGAIGPMQFMPSTFAAYAVAAPNTAGVPDIHNVYDAIYTCAHMLAADGYHHNPLMALYQYNHSMAYVDSVWSYAASV